MLFFKKNEAFISLIFDIEISENILLILRFL